LLDALQEQRGQVVLTTTRPELVDVVAAFGGDSTSGGPTSQVRFEVQQGQIQRM
jgi:hypothetical protein